MSRIAATFDRLSTQGRKALIPFFTAGDPNRGITVPLMHALVDAGADIIELGVPFSDPMADGPTIQRSSERALKHGTSLSDVLDMVKEFRTTNTKTPVVLMGYANPIERMTYVTFCARAKHSGVDGVLVVDYPPEECGDLVAQLKESGIDTIFLLAPTTSPERMERVGRLASGYVYYVSLKGVTGAAHIDVSEVAAKVPEIKAHCGVPVGVGFGIRDGATAAAVAKVADAVVIGSRIVQEIETSGPDRAIVNVHALVSQIRQVMDKA
jgi:tryptophan synthase alpha chain